MTEANVLQSDEYEARFAAYAYARAEESRAVRAGEKDVSELAAIVERYRDLFTRPQLDALQAAKDGAATADERERHHRLARACLSGIVTAELAELQDEVRNAELALRVRHRGEELPLRAASARLSVVASYEEREELGPAVFDASATLNDRWRELARVSEELSAELTGEPDPIARSEAEKQVVLRPLAELLAEVAEETAEAYAELRKRWLDRLLGPERAERPPSYHAAFVFRLTPLADVYTKERATEVCLATLDALGCDLRRQPNIHTDLEDRPQKAPRPVVIAADPPRVVHLLTRPLGGLQDYQDFLHEAGHALHYAGCDPELPFAFRALARDYALTEIYSYVVQSIVREPGWHRAHFALAEDTAADNAEIARFLDAFMFRRYLAKLRFELGFWSRFADDGGTPEGYAEELTDATGFVYRADRYLADMDAGFYSADYLRAWIRSAQLRAYLRAEIGEDWWRRAETGSYLAGLFREGLRPSNEEIARRIGREPFDVAPLVAELTGSREAIA